MAGGGLYGGADADCEGGTLVPVSVLLPVLLQNEAQQSVTIPRDPRLALFCRSPAAMQVLSMNCCLASNIKRIFRVSTFAHSFSTTSGELS